MPGYDLHIRPAFDLLQLEVKMVDHRDMEAALLELLELLPAFLRAVYVHFMSVFDLSCLVRGA